MNNLFGKYAISICAGLMAYYTPLKEVFLFVGIRKFWVSLGYFIGISVARSFEIYTHQELIVKPVAMIIAISEVQSLRENILALTKVDIIKPITNLFTKNHEKTQ